MCHRIFKEQTSTNGDIPFYKIGTFGNKADSFISTEIFEEYKTKYPYPEKGDILISASGSIGKIIEFTGENEYFQDSNIVWLKHDKRLVNSFLKHFYSIVKWSGIEGSTIKRLYNDNILDTYIHIPSIQEQQCIGSFFNHIDNLINLHQQKLTLLNKYKEGLYKTIFSNVSVESKVSLKDIIMPLKKTSHKSGDGKADGKYIFFTNTTSENFKYFDSYDYDEEIIIANTGGTANFKYYKGKFAAMSDCYIFKTSENTQYIYYWLDYMKDIIDRLGFRGNGIKHLDKRWFLSLTLKLPSFTEQTKIVNLLNSFDSIIDKETQTLNQLKLMKAGLLQQMFI